MCPGKPPVCRVIELDIHIRVDRPANIDSVVIWTGGRVVYPGPILIPTSRGAANRHCGSEGDPAIRGPCYMHPWATAPNSQRAHITLSIITETDHRVTRSRHGR